MTWPLCRIDDIAEIFDGPHATPKSTKTATSGPYFLGISSLDSGRLNLSLSPHLSEDDFEKWSRRTTPRHGDVVFSYETRLGQAALIPRGFHGVLGRRMALMRPDLRRVTPGFLLYYFLSPRFQDVIRQRAVTGSTVDRILLTEFPDYPIHVPPLPEQQGIATTLGALDDKIESARRQSNSINGMQHALWKHAALRANHKRPLLDFTSPLLGGTPKRTNQDYWGGDICWASVRDMTSAEQGIVTGTSEHIAQPAVDSAARHRPHPAGSVFLTARGTVGRVVTNAVPCAINQSAYAFSSEVRKSALLRLAIESSVDHLRQLAHGSTFDAITTRDIAEMCVPDLDQPAFLDIEDTLQSLEELRFSLASQALKASVLRDALLPELMSGRIRVPEAREAVEGAVGSPEEDNDDDS